MVIVYQKSFLGGIKMTEFIIVDTTGVNLDIHCSSMVIVAQEMSSITYPVVIIQRLQSDTIVASYPSTYSPVLTAPSPAVTTTKVTKQHVHVNAS